MKKYFLSVLLATLLISCKDNPTKPKIELSDKWDGSSYTQLTSENGIYQIYYPSQLAWIAKTANDGFSFTNETIILMNNIDLSDKKFPGIAIADNAKFMGIFDGNGFSIKGINIESDKNNVGFIGYLDTNAIIKNLNLTGDIIVTSSGIVKVGSVVGLSYGLVTNVTNSVNIKATISQDSTGTALAYIGGIVGMNNSAIGEVVNKGNITATVAAYIVNSSVGGIAGWLGLESSIFKCYNSGNISSLKDTATESIAYVGGLVGNIFRKENEVSISRSYNVGNIENDSDKCVAGGLIGNVESGNVSILNSYNTGTINIQATTGIVGGLIGNGNSTTKIDMAYNIGDISSSTATTQNEIGENLISVNSVYYLANTGAQGELTSANFGLYNSFPDFDFATIWAMSKMNAATGMPQTRPILLGVGYYLPPIPAPPVDVPR